jgi:hypothetical protein
VFFRGVTAFEGHTGGSLTAALGSKFEFVDFFKVFA